MEITTLTLDEAIQILNERKHRGIATWRKVVADYNNPPTWDVINDSVSSENTRLNKFEVIAIATAYCLEIFS